MDLGSFLLELYWMVDTWVQTHAEPSRPRRGRPVRLSTSEVLTLAIVQQFPRFRSERDFWQYADRHLRACFPALVCQSQLNRRTRQLFPLLVAMQHDLAAELSGATAPFHLMDTSLFPVMERVRSTRHGCFAGEAGFGRCASKTEWVYGFKLGLVTDLNGVITTFGIASGNTGERKIGDALIARDGYGAYLVDKGFSGLNWQTHWRTNYGAIVAVPPKAKEKRVLSPQMRRWSASHRQRIEGVFHHLKDYFGLERHRAKQMDGLLVRVAAKITAYTCAQAINRVLGRPLCQMPGLLL